MIPKISHIPFHRNLVIPDRYLFISAVLYALPVVLLYSWRPIAGIAAAVIPCVVFLIAHAPSAVLVLIAATFLFIPLTGPVSLLPGDLAALILITAYIVDLLIRGQSRQHNPLAVPLLLYLAVMLISLSLGGFTTLSIRFFTRQLVLAGTFFAVAHFGARIGVKRVLIWFVTVAGLHSLYSISQFLMAGGTIRAFGLAGRGYGDHVMLTFLISSVFFLWSEDLRARILWGIAGMLSIGGLVATQTRASALTAAWAVMIAVAITLWNGRKIKISTPRKNLVYAIIFSIIAGIVLISYTSFFEGIVRRFERIGPQASETILLRLILWKAALAAFVKYPIFGIGPGNYAIVKYWVPDVRFSHIYYLVSGLGTHAVAMTALAETGLAGVLALAFFFGRAIRTAYRNMVGSETSEDLVITQCLMVATLAIVGSSVYAGSWFWGNNSYHMAVLFGVVASYRHHGTIVMSKGARL